MFDAIANKINQMLDRRMASLVEHLSVEQNKLKIQIKINSTKDVSVEIEASSKHKLDLSPETRKLPAKNTLFKADKYQQEITQAINHYVTSCRFQSLPTTINIFVKSDNTITGNLISNFVFNRK